MRWSFLIILIALIILIIVIIVIIMIVSENLKTVSVTDSLIHLITAYIKYKIFIKYKMRRKSILRHSDLFIFRFAQNFSQALTKF